MARGTVGSGVQPCLARPVRIRGRAGRRRFAYCSRPVVPAIMNSFATTVLAFSMSADAFAAALGKGSVLHRPRLGEALRTGLVFGTVEAITPVIGWAAGIAASTYIAAIDHWIAFALLLVTAVGTSIDAMAVGVTLALVNADIAMTAVAIGLATFLMTTIGILIGRIIGGRFGRMAEALGGLGLIGIGTRILIEHTMLG